MKIVRHCLKPGVVGFGDFLRGSCCLWEICQKEGYSLRLYYRTHPIIGLLLTSSEEDQQISNTPWFNYVKYYHEDIYRNVLNYLKFSGPTVNISTNLSPEPELSNFKGLSSECKDFMRQNLKMEPLLQKAYDNLNFENYSVVQLRIGDPVEPREISEDLNSKIQKILEDLHLTGQIVLISDNSLVRDRMASLFGYTTLKTYPVHTYEQTSDKMSDFQGTLLEFFVLSKAQHIYQLAVYNRPSGFGYWAAQIYDIPINIFPI